MFDAFVILKSRKHRLSGLAIVCAVISFMILRRYIEWELRKVWPNDSERVLLNIL